MSAADFILLPPVAVVDALLTSTNVQEVAAGPEYAGGTTYALGQIAGTTVGNVQTVYRSLQAGNTGHTQTSSPTWWQLIGTACAEYAGGTTYGAGDMIGTTAGTVQTIYKSLQAANTGHTQASSPTWWEPIGVVYRAYDVTVTYAANDIVSLLGADVHLLYKSVGAGNIGQSLTDVTKWLAYGSTNARAMFDTTYGSQTTNADSISFVVNPGQLVNALFFGNVTATSITITQSGSGWTKTVALASHNVNNWYDWFYVPPVSMKDLVLVNNIPAYPSSTLTITITNAGGIASCGLFVMGIGRVIGQTGWELLAGILTFSGTTTDAFGNTTFVKRASAKKINCDVLITPGFEDEAYRLLSLCTDAPGVFIATTDYQIGAAYGYLYDWKVPISVSSKPMPIEIRGLT